MRQILRTRAICLLGAIACVAVLNTDAGAQGYATTSGSVISHPEGRAGTWDFFIPITYNPSSSWKGPEGSSIRLDDDWGVGFGGGYNFTDSFQLNGLFTWIGQDYTATIVNSDLSRRQYSNTVNTSTVSLNGILYLLKGKVAPFVSGGLGFTYLDTGIRTAPGPTVCWWDPWLGFVCNSTAQTRTETDFSYNAGVGVRWDVFREYSLQASYNKMWIDIHNASGTPDFDVWRLDFVFRIP